MSKVRFGVPIFEDLSPVKHRALVSFLKDLSFDLSYSIQDLKEKLFRVNNLIKQIEDEMEKK